MPSKTMATDSSLELDFRYSSKLKLSSVDDHLYITWSTLDNLPPM